METVNWTLAIERNREALLRVVAMLFAMAGLENGGSAATLPRHLRNHVLRILRPAEAAVRRLVIIAARGLGVVVKPRRPTTTTSVTTASAGTLAGRPGALSVIDPLPDLSFRPRRRRPKAFPRICVIGLSEPTPIPDNWIPSPDDEVGAAGICRRLATLRRALDDLGGHAKRLARWRARRDLGLNRTGRFNPMRPGRPPGHRKRPIHAVDDILRECHSLAVYSQRLDSS